MSCWEGHVPRMNEEQMAQAIHAYMHAFEVRWQQQPWAPQMEPTSARRPMQKSRTALPRATDGDKAGAIDVEFVRVR